MAALMVTEIVPANRVAEVPRVHDGTGEMGWHSCSSGGGSGSSRHNLFFPTQSSRCVPYQNSTVTCFVPWGFSNLRRDRSAAAVGLWEATSSTFAVATAHHNARSTGGPSKASRTDAETVSSMSEALDAFRFAHPSPGPRTPQRAPPALSAQVSVRQETLETSHHSDCPSLAGHREPRAFAFRAAADLDSRAEAAGG